MRLMYLKQEGIDDIKIIFQNINLILQMIQMNGS